MSKNNASRDAIFNWLFLDLASENGAKIHGFSIFFGKRRFYENRAPVEAGTRLSWFRAFKNLTKIDAKKHSKKVSKKDRKNQVLASVLASENL